MILRICHAPTFLRICHTPIFLRICHTPTFSHLSHARVFALLPRAHFFALVTRALFRTCHRTCCRFRRADRDCRIRGSDALVRAAEPISAGCGVGRCAQPGAPPRRGRAQPSLLSLLAPAALEGAGCSRRAWRRQRIRGRKLPRKACSLSLPKCRTPTFAMCPIYYIYIYIYIYI